MKTFRVHVVDRETKNLVKDIVAESSNEAQFLAESQEWDEASGWKLEGSIAGDCYVDFVEEV